MSVLDSENYKIALKDTLQAKKALFGSQFTYTKMAEACNVQKTYLSKVLNRDGDLSEDQLYLACDFLKLSEDETEYLLLLHQYARAQVLKRKRQIEQKLKDIRDAGKRTEAGFEKDGSVETQFDQARYYLDPIMQVIHMCMTVPELSKAPSKLAKKLLISDQQMANCLGQLQKMGLITNEKGQFRVIADNLHLPQDSPLYRPYRSALRQKALEHCGRLSDDEVYSLSAIVSIDESSTETILKDFLKFLKITKNKVKKAEPETVYQLNFDFLRWA